MAALLIILNQTGKPAGTAGNAREDFVTGTPIQASLQGGPFGQYLWTLDDKPIDFPNAVQSSAAPVLPQAASTPVQPIDVEGSYLLKCLVDSGQGLGATPDDVATITFYAGTALSAVNGYLPQRQPAFGERAEHNVLDAMFSGGRNKRGWAQTMGRWFEIIKKNTKGSALTWGRVSLSFISGANLVQGSNVASVSRVSVGVVDVTFITPQSTISYGVIGAARGVGGGISGSNENFATVRISRGDAFGSLVDADFTFGILST